MNDEQFHWTTYWETKALSSRNWLCERYHYLVSATRKRMLPYTHDWEDVEQEGVLTLIQAIETYDPSRGTKFTTYAIRCIRGKYGKLVSKYVKKQERHTPLFDETGEPIDSSWVIEHLPNPEEQIVMADSCEFVRAKVEELKPHLREVMVRRYWEEKTLHTIASELQRSVPAIFYREKTCFKILREEIPEDLFNR